MRRGVGSVVAIVLISLLAIVGAAIFLRAYLKTVGEGTSDDTASCFGIDLELKTCYIFDERLNQLNSPGVPHIEQGTYALLMNVERWPGGRKIKDLRFEIQGENGNTYPASPTNVSTTLFSSVTDYSNFTEYSSVEVVVNGLPNLPDYVRVSAVVGESETICAPTREAIKCDYFLWGNPSAP